VIAITTRPLPDGRTLLGIGLTEATVKLIRERPQMPTEDPSALIDLPMQIIIYIGKDSHDLARIARENGIIGEGFEWTPNEAANRLN
jgi:hypothetical protein